MPRPPHSPRLAPRRRPLAKVVASTPTTVAGARAAAAARFERKTAIITELDLDKCQNTFGIAPCNAVGAAGTECKNTFGTCKDSAGAKTNYRKGIYTLKFCGRGMALPAGEAPMRPYIEELRIAPSDIDPTEGLAVRSSTTILMADEPCSDREFDPYIATRTSVAQGTFWTRLLARTKNAAGRFARVRRGFVQTPWSWDTFQTELYIIESILGPDQNGKFKVTLSDAIRLLDRSSIPVATDGKLAADVGGPSNAGIAQAGNPLSITLAKEASPVDGFYVGQEVYITANTASGQRRTITAYEGITRIATINALWSVIPDTTSVYEVSPLSLTLDKSGELYPDPSATGIPGFVRIGDEVIRYTARAGNVLSWPDGTYRAQFKTTRTTQKANAGVQLCRVWLDQAANQVVTDLLVEGGLAIGYVDVAGLLLEATNWLATARITACISNPEQSSALLKEILQDLNLLCWWDPVAQLVKFKSDAPVIAGAITELTDDNLIGRQTIAIPQDADRITRAAIYYDPRSATVNLTEAKNFERGDLRIDGNAESANEYGDVRPDIRYSRWFSSANTVFVPARVARRIGRLRDAPILLQFQLDPRDECALGDLKTIRSKAIVDDAGAPKPVRVRITKKVDRLTHLEMEARTTNLDARYGFISPTGFPDYAVASDLQRQYGYISNNGVMSDGSTGYVIA